ncbi:hypothetical protein PCANC_13909 [Puccinia coronata f. sp. avenae]|uniref:Uncharacterized protein n=1 Tax=Puccinia coronata f. sp. avenae TaxID=200324 RepID=A0A2N5SPQ5_9BASI|nr:hypothetical protein PCANC_13909 [Puccinia coronata f. sp. avenae]
MAHSAAQSTVPPADSKAESTTRRLRTRAPRSNFPPHLFLDDMEFSDLPNHGIHISKNLISAQKLEESSMSIDPVNQPAGNKVNRRLNISRQHRVPTPPPLPSPDLPWARPDTFPAWLLGMAMVKSSPKYMASRKTPETQKTNPLSGQIQPNISTSPIRRAASSLLGTSPLKSSFEKPLSRQSSSYRLDFRHHSIGRSLSPEEALDRRREKYWESYEYDSTSPHLQPKYFDKPLPTNEQWADLDIQNAALIPEPQPGPATIHLCEVFAPTILDTPHPQPPRSSSHSEAEPSSKSAPTQFTQQEIIESMPFGFNCLPSDYRGHRR